MNSQTIYSNSYTDDVQLEDSWSESGQNTRQTIFSTVGDIGATGYTTNNENVTNNNIRNRSRSGKTKRVRQGFSGQWAPEFERIYPKPVDLDKSLGKAIREARYHSIGWNYMSGGQWFNPFSLHPHPVLEQKNDLGSSFGTFGLPGVSSFDTYLKIYGMMPDIMKDITTFHMSNGGHMGIVLDTMKNKRSKYFDQNLNEASKSVSSQEQKGIDYIRAMEAKENAQSGALNAIWTVGQNDLGNKDKQVTESDQEKNRTVKKTLVDRRSTLRFVYCLAVDLFLFLNIVRMIACHFMVQATPLLQDTIDGGRMEVDPLENYIRGQGLRPPKGFGGLAVPDGPPDIYMRFAFGDLSPFWTRRPHMVTVMVIVLTSFALLINLFFQFYQTDRSKRWIVPFAVLTGHITPADARIRSKHQLDKMEQNVRHSFRLALILTIFWTLIWSGFYFWSALTFTEVPENLVEDVKNGLIYARNKKRVHLVQYYFTSKSVQNDGNSSELEIANTIADGAPKLISLGSYKVSLFWAMVNSINAFFVTGIVIWSLTYFHCLTWYIRIRFKRLNKISYALLDLSNGIIPLVKRNDFMAEVLHEHNLTSADVTVYNRFWKWYLLICHFFFVPVTFWLVYIVSFYWQGTWLIKVCAIVVALQFASFMAVMVASGETVSNQAHLVWLWLNTLCLYEWPIVIKFRMAYLIERLGGPTLGFTCYDFFVVARETFYEMALLLGTYFLLTYEFVLSSL